MRGRQLPCSWSGLTIVLYVRCCTATLQTDAYVVAPLALLVNHLDYAQLAFSTLIPMQDAEVTTVADGSASLLKLVEKACTSMLSKQLSPTETSLAVKNLNLPANFHLLNSGKGDLPGEVVRVSPLSLRSLAISLGADHCCSIVIVLSKTLVMVSRHIPDSGSQQIWV